MLLCSSVGGHDGVVQQGGSTTGWGWMILGKREHKEFKIKNWICETFLLIWKNLQDKLALNLSPLVPFLNHSKFSVARETGKLGTLKVD